jgi:hypothetical protein
MKGARRKPFSIMGKLSRAAALLSILIPAGALLVAIPLMRFVVHPGTLFGWAGCACLGGFAFGLLSMVTSWRIPQSAPVASIIGTIASAIFAFVGFTLWVLSHLPV